MNARLLFCLLWLTPLLCQGASFTSYFLNIEALTNSVARNEMRALTSVFTNSTTVNGSLITGVANPSGLIGMSAVNGVATTLQRSDSRQAIDPAIDPTFTGSWTFAPSASDAGFVITNSAITQVPLTINGFTGQTADLQRWNVGGVQKGLFSPTGVRLGSGVAFAITQNGAAITGNRSIIMFDNGTATIQVNGQMIFGQPATETAWATVLAEAANTLAMRNGTAAQVFNVYGTFTDTSNYRRGFISGSTGGTTVVGSSGAGTGATGNSLQLATDGTSRWVVTSGGHFLALADNTYDIGASGATRPRDLYLAGVIRFGGQLQMGNGAGTKLINSSDGVLRLSDSAATDFNRLQFGGTSASFPSLKRSTTELQVRLADDSADGGLKSGNLSNTGIRVMTPSTLQTLAAANALLANATKVRVVGSGGAVTLTSTPTIADGTDGQYVMIQGTDDTNTLTVQDQGSLASSNLELGAATRVLGAGDVLCLTFDSTASVWYEVSFANN